MTDPLRVHYAGHDDLADLIRERLLAAGKSMAALTTRDLAPVDEFHIRGRQATLELAVLMGVEPGAKVVDLGSGLGGPARTIAETFGCDVTGIDLTPRFVAAANRLSRWVKLEARTRFVTGDATHLPFTAELFDAAMTIHVAMNIAAKYALYADAHRVLRPGGRLAIHDVVLGEAAGPIVYPVPWAAEARASHLVTRAELRRLVEAAGFAVLHDQDTTAQSRAWLAERRLARPAAAALALELVMGKGFGPMTRNLATNLEQDRVRTATLIAQR